SVGEGACPEQAAASAASAGGGGGGAADLAVSLAADNASPRVGDRVTYTATVSDVDAGGATGVALDLVLPRQVSVVSTSADRGAGRDRVVADRGDVLVHCERVTRP